MYYILIVEDEPLARSYLIDLLNDINDSSHTIRSAATIDKAYELIQDQTPDMMFLDINLENRSGLELLEMIQPYSFPVIFTTAHPKYAIDAFKHGAIDFLHKPFDQDALQASYEKAIRRIEESTMALIDTNSRKRPKNLIVPSTDGHLIIQQSKIIYCEADSNYSKIWFDASHYILTSKNLGEIEKLLDPIKFYRIHQSFVVNTSCIVRITKNRPYRAELINGNYISVSERRRTEFINHISNLSI